MSPLILYRVFTFGIGDGVSTSLVKGAAHAGKGKCVLVKDTKDLPDQVSVPFLGLQAGGWKALYHQ